MKVLNILLLCFILNYCHASNPENNEDNNEKVHQISPIDEDPDFIQAMKNFETKKNFIQTYLSNLKEAELHFFWTTGYTFSDNSDYQPNKEFKVGGLRYEHKIFPYVEKLLKVSPSHFKVKFICDTLTFDSNQSQLNALANKHNSRFEIVPIETVQRNLLSVFSSDEQPEKIKTIFKNATQGSPVIASDIYRIIGMIYGHNPLPKNITQNQYTYCDIDTFCYGIERNSHGRDHSKDLIKSLFKNTVKSSFYFGRSKYNNDLIKLHINNLIDYKDFCDRTLNRVNISSIAVNYYSQIHDSIKSYETFSDQGLNIKLLIPKCVQDMIGEVVKSTGPNFIKDEKVSHDLFYPEVSAGEWFPKEDLLDYNGREHCHPKYVLMWDFNHEFIFIGENRCLEEEKEALNLFSQNCDDYTRFISAALYSKRFGENHPFNIAIKQYLRE